MRIAIHHISTRSMIVKESQQMYLQNKYTRWYYSIVQRAQTRVLSDNTYTEKHHIIPRSLGGNNSQENLVRLTAREHFVCHLLLTKMTDGNNKRKMSYALWLMCNQKNCNQNERYVPNSNRYAVIRKQHSIVASANLKGKKKTYSSFAGKKHSEYSRKLMSEKAKGRSNKASHTKEWSEKVSKAQIGIPKPVFTCNHCGKLVGGKSNLNRWHNDNCSLNR